MSKGRPGGNPLIIKKPIYGEPMAVKPMSIRLPVDLDEFLRAIPNRADWLREAIVEKRQRDLGVVDKKTDS